MDTSENKPGRSWKFKLGVIFLIINIPFGLIGAAIGVWLAAKTGHKLFWGTFGTMMYAIGWALFGFGILLAGPEGKQIVKQLFNKYFRRNKTD